LIEAKSFGLPCISLDSELSSGPREIIRDEVDGFVCKDKKGFLKAMNALMNHTKYRDYSKKSFDDYIQRFSKEAAFANWSVMLNEAFK
jgi:glycosyltransferase involved in cell wall biosynthesis